MLEPSELFPEIPNLYEFPSIHADMLFDEERVNRYSEAIAATIRPGDVVADIGTGTGLLAFLCLEAGAKRVHAIERSVAIKWAERIAARNGYANRIVFHHADSRNIDSLTEPVDVIVTETIGHIAFEEGMVESLFDSRRRFLREDGRIIPRHTELRVALVTEPEIYRNFIDCWDRVSGIDYSPLREDAVRAWYLTTFQDHHLMSEPKRFFKVDFENDQLPALQGETSLTACRAGEVNGIALWFDTELAPGVHVSSDPWSRTHWGQCFAPIPSPLSVEAGEGLSLRVEMDLCRKPDDHFAVRVSMDRAQG